MKRDALILAILLTASVATQAFVISRAVTPAQDAVRFVAIAQRMEREGLLPTLRDESEHPAYPVMIRAAHPAVCWIRGSRADNWVLAAQFAAALPLVLCVAPIFALLRLLVPRGPALLTTLLFSLAPAFASLGGSALADGWMLLFATCFLWASARVISRAGAEVAPSRRCAFAWAAMSGGTLGLAATAHQLAFVCGAAGMLLASICLLTTSDSLGARFARLGWCAAGCCLGLTVILGGWLALAQADSAESMVARLLGRETEETDEIAALFDDEDTDWSVDDESNEPTAADANARPRRKRVGRWEITAGEKMSFDKKDPNASIRKPGLAAAGMKLGSKLPQALGWPLGLLALAGVAFRTWRRSGANDNSTQPPDRRRVQLLLTGCFALYVFALWLLAARFGYLEERHLLPAVIATLPLVGTAIGFLAECIAGRLPRTSASAFPRARVRPWAFAAGLAVIALVSFLPLLSPLHASRAAFRDAAQWMAQPDLPQGTVLDTRGWTQFYSGRPTHLLSAGRQALKDPQLKYIVLEQQELEFDSSRAATLRAMVEALQQPVATFAVPGGKPEKTVLVYEWDLERFARRKSRTTKR